VPDPGEDVAFDAESICVIEPHADDAFLSLGWSIRKWAKEGKQVEVVTVYSADPGRAREAKRWATWAGAAWRGLGFEGCPADGLALAVEAVPPLPTPLLPDDLMTPAWCRIWPLGLPHLEHEAVAAAAPDRDLHYVDTPYQLDLFGQRAVRRALIGRTIAWWQQPPRKKWDGRRFFRSQAVLFEHFPPEVLESVPEIVVR
jgi:LmbE family N-acetylglucosaminyl deacetylase